MKKTLIALLLLASGCTERGCTSAQMLNNNKRPFTIVSKSAPYSASNGNSRGCFVRLRGQDGNMFELNDCDMCRSYEVGDTIR